MCISGQRAKGRDRLLGVVTRERTPRRRTSNAPTYTPCGAQRITVSLLAGLYDGLYASPCRACCLCYWLLAWSVGWLVGCLLSLVWLFVCLSVSAFLLACLPACLRVGFRGAAPREEAPLRNSSVDPSRRRSSRRAKSIFPQDYLFLVEHAVATLRTRSRTHTLT